LYQHLFLTEIYPNLLSEVAKLGCIHGAIYRQ